MKATYHGGEDRVYPSLGIVAVDGDSYEVGKQLPDHRWTKDETSRTTRTETK